MDLALFDVEKLLELCPELQKLNLADNKLDNRSINEDSLSETTSLSHLILKNNQLDSIRHVRNLHQLRHLDLCNNMLKSVVEDGVNLLGSFVYLQHLDLSGNQIRSFDHGLASHLRVWLKCFNISKNPLDQSLDIGPLKKEKKKDCCFNIFFPLINRKSI